MSGNRRHFHIFIFLFVCGPLVGGAEEEWPAGQGSTVPDHVVELHTRAVEGSEASVDEAIDALDELLRREPENVLARAYLGNVYTLKARDVALLRKRAWLNRGLETLDTAVELAPDDPRVRLIRAVNSYNLPRMADRYALASADFSVLLDTLGENPEEFSASLRREIYFHAGAFALKEGHHDRAVCLLENAAKIQGGHDLEQSIETMLRAARDRIGER